MMNQSTQGLASLGRNGDTMLMHVNPDELRGLQGLAMSQGGSLSINPHTGLPEAFNLGGFLKSLLPMAAGIATGGAGAPLWAGIAAGAGVGALTNKNKLLGAVTGGLGGYGGFGMGKGFFAAGAPEALPASASMVGPSANTAVNTSLSGVGSSMMTNPNIINAGIGSAGVGNLGASMMTDPTILNAQNASNALNAAGGGAGSPIANSAASTAEKALSAQATYGDKLSQTGTGFKNVFTGEPGTWDKFKGSFTEPGEKMISDLSGYSKIALPIGGAALGGLEESDIYGKPFNMAAAKEAEKYDPYSRLNLNKDTGLRLVANGGLINSYATGGTVQSDSMRDLYGGPDNQPTMSTGLGGFGLGRLNNLANAQAINQASLTGYAEGGVAELSLVDNPATTPDQNQAVAPEQTVLTEAAKTQAYENEMSKLGITGLGVGNIPTNNFAPGSLATIANAMKNQNVPPEAAFVQNLTGARTGYADGGDVSNYRQDQEALNLNELPTLNVNTGTSIPRDEYYDFYSKHPGLHNAANMIFTQNNVTPLGRKIINTVFTKGNWSPNLPEGFATGGLTALKPGGYLSGQGDGMSDSIPATIEGKQPARLADGEFVVPADVVSHLGNGSSKAGSKRLYAMLDKIRHARTGNKKQGKQINPSKYMPA